MEENENTRPEEGGAPDELERERQRLNADAEDFAGKYPEVDLYALEEEPRFRRFCGSRLYKESIASLYEDYLSFTRETEQSAREKERSRRDRGTGSGGGQGSSGLSERQERELEEWNRAFPAMRMSAAEFKKR